MTGKPLGTFDGLVEELDELVYRNRDGDGEDLTVAVDEIVARHVQRRQEVLWNV